MTGFKTQREHAELRYQQQQKQDVWGSWAVLRAMTFLWEGCHPI
jgi:hypothetical protein